ncbi:alpha/beta fold hydrolase [Allokutzneria oryzae]|uniref:Alpha/beta fold hydrolase n=1 Tax=Allokutzneria oryzae TaxID=1378989 RepID=A0ABV6A6J5_9PSEU
MATYVLVHGAGSDSWYWHLVTAELVGRGHDVVAPDLPVADESAGLAEYTEAVVRVIGDREDLIVVAQSMAGFTAPLVCERVPVTLLVLLAAMVPAPGESPGQWWGATGHEQARRELDEREGRDPDAPFDPEVTFLHDVPQDVREQLFARGGGVQADRPFADPWPLAEWPDVPTRFLLCQDDRFFPSGFQRRIAEERLGITADEMPGGHLPALARPLDLVERLEEYRRGRG